MSAVSVGRVASIFSVFWRNTDSNRLNHGSMRMVLLPNVISQPLVPNHLKLTPAGPGPPPRGEVSAPSAAPGASRERPRFAVAIATPATMPFARKPRLDHSESTKHMSVSSREPHSAHESWRFAPILPERVAKVKPPSIKNRPIVSILCQVIHP